MAETLEVFVSSVISGMEADRQAVAAAIQAIQLEAVVFELLGAYPESARTISLEKARECDVFIQLIGTTVSPIVADEYDAAKTDNPDKVLVFVRQGTHDASAKDHLARVRRRHKYGSYETPKELEAIVKKSLASWISRRLRRTGHRKVSRSLIIDADTAELGTWALWWYRFEVERGDRIRGTLTANRRDYTFDAWLFDEGEWAGWRNDPDQYEPDVHEGIAFAIDEKASRSETWYIAVKILAWNAPFKLHLRLVRERG